MSIQINQHTMTLAYWCVLIAALMPYVFTAIAKFSGPGFSDDSNRAPREFLDKLDGARKRAHWAQLNSFEAFPAFAAAVIIAHLTGGAAQGTIDALAVAFILIRSAYGYLYLQDIAKLRTPVWAAGLACVIALFIAAA